MMVSYHTRTTGILTDGNKTTTKVIFISPPYHAIADSYTSSKIIAARNEEIAFAAQRGSHSSTLAIDPEPLQRQAPYNIQQHATTKQ